MATPIVPDVLTLEQARALKAQAIELGKLGDLTNRVLVPLLDGVNPAYEANHMMMWEVLNEGEAQASPIVEVMAVAA